MNTKLTSLEIQVHLCNGNITRFVQYDPQIIQHLLAHIHPDRIFTQREILLVGDHSLTAYPSSAVTRMDLVMEGCPAWEFHQNISDIVEITPNEFQQRLALQISQPSPHFNPDGTRYVFGEMELVNGQHLFREVHLKPSSAVVERNILPQDYTMLLHQQFSVRGHYCRRRGGGAILVNPEHLVRMTFYPGTTTPPGHAWRMQAVKH